MEKITVAHAVRDVLLRSMDKGQAPLFVGALVLLVILVRLPPESLARLMDRVLDGFQNWWVTGYVLFGATLVAWAIHTKWIRRAAFREEDRMSKEKTRLQRKQIGKSMKSSGN